MCVSAERQLQSRQLVAGATQSRKDLFCQTRPSVVLFIRSDKIHARRLEPSPHPAAGVSRERCRKAFDGNLSLLLNCVLDLY